MWGLSDTSGAQVERYLYSDPYGMSSTVDASGTGIGDYASEVYHQKRLHGGVVDAATELYDFRNRWMDSKSGVWHSPDLAGGLVAAKWNHYQVCESAPTVLLDVDGTECWYWWEASVWVRPLRPSGLGNTARFVNRGYAHSFTTCIYWKMCDENCSSGSCNQPPPPGGEKNPQGTGSGGNGSGGGGGNHGRSSGSTTLEMVFYFTISLWEADTKGQNAYGFNYEADYDAVASTGGKGSIDRGISKWNNQNDEKSAAMCTANMVEMGMLNPPFPRPTFRDYDKNTHNCNTYTHEFNQSWDTLPTPGPNFLLGW